MKKLASILLALTLCLAMSIPAFAVAQKAAPQKSATEIEARAEVTQWRYRVYNGQNQKRLWSITYERWLTDWMPYSS